MHNKNAYFVLDFVFTQAQQILGPEIAYTPCLPILYQLMNAKAAVREDYLALVLGISERTASRWIQVLDQGKFVHVDRDRAGPALIALSKRARTKVAAIFAANVDGLTEESDRPTGTLTG